VPNRYAVVGEHRDNPDQYLVRGDDGQYYAWDLATEQTTPVEPGEEWRMDATGAADVVRFEDLVIDPRPHRS
jgi:hypothetical protein